MNKILITLLIILLIGNLSAGHIAEQEVYGILQAGKSLPNQKVAVDNPLIADFGLGPNNQFSYLEDIEDIDVVCEKITGPENLVVYKNEPGKCIVRWDDGLTANPTEDEKGKHYVEIKVENTNEDAFFYSFNIMVYSWMANLDKKWNLISIPVNSINPNITDILEDISENIEEVWSYENKIWKVYYPDNLSESTLYEIIPGRGYWIKTNNSTLLIAGDLFEEITTPNSVPLNNGWNLIGHYGINSKPAYCSLSSLVNTQQGFPRWSAVVGYDSSSKQFHGLSPLDIMYAGKGYWIEMDGENLYSPILSC